MHKLLAMAPKKSDLLLIRDLKEGIVIVIETYVAPDAD